MDFIVPIGVVIYIIASIIGAVLKALNNASGPEPSRPDWHKKPDPTEDVSQPVSSRESEIELVEPFKMEEESRRSEVPAVSEVTITTHDALATESPGLERLEESRDIDEHWEQADVDWERKAKPSKKQPVLQPLVLGALKDRQQVLRNAILLSEIIREPRAKRSWPNR